MLIEKIEAIAISIPLKKDFGGSTYHVTRRCTVITRIHAGGLVSEVYNGDNREHGAEIVRMAHHEEAQVAQHLLTAIPHGTYLECFADPDRDPVWQAMWLNRPAIKNGMADIADEPGLGIKLDWNMIGKYRVA